MRIDHFAVAGRVGQMAEERTRLYIEKVAANRRRAQGILPLDEAYALLKKDFDALTENSNKAINSFIQESSFNMMQKFKERTEKLANHATRVYLLSSDQFRPKEKEAYPLSDLKKIDEKLLSLAYQGLSPLTKSDIGKPLYQPIPKSLIDEKSFSGKEEDHFYDLTDDQYYTVEDYEIAMGRLNHMIDHFEEEGRKNGLFVD